MGIAADRWTPGSPENRQRDRRDALFKRKLQPLPIGANTESSAHTGARSPERASPRRSTNAEVPPVRVPVFYRSEMSVRDNASYSPSAGKPTAVLDDWLAAPDIREHIEVVSFKPVNAAVITQAHGTDHVAGVLSGEMASGFGPLRLQHFLQVLQIDLRQGRALVREHVPSKTKCARALPGGCQPRSAPGRDPVHVMNLALEGRVADERDRLAAVGVVDHSEAAHGHLPERDRKSTRLNSSHLRLSRMPSSA